MTGLRAAVLAALLFGSAGPVAADPGRDDPAPLLALVRDVCLKPKHSLDAAIAAAETSMRLVKPNRSTNELGEYWDAWRPSETFGVSYLMLGAIGGDLANGLMAHANGDSSAVETALRATPGVTLSERKPSEYSHPDTEAWSLTGSSADGALTLELSSSKLILPGGVKTNSYGITCGKRAGG